MPLESQLPQYERWARFLKNGQMGNVFFLPWVGMMYRIAQFVEYVGKVRLIDLQNVVEEGVDLIGELPKKGKLIIIMRRILLSPHGMRIAREMEKWLVEFEGGVLFVHEMASCELSINHDWPSWVVASRNNYQLPEQGGMEIYIKNINREMGVSLNKEESKEIARAYGGWWWLVDDIRLHALQALLLFCFFHIIVFSCFS